MGGIGFWDTVRQGRIESVAGAKKMSKNYNTDANNQAATQVGSVRRGRSPAVMQGLTPHDGRKQSGMQTPQKK